MILKLTYKYKEESMEIEITCANYTFGLPKLFYLFYEKHKAGLNRLKKEGIVTDVVINSFYGGRWRILSSAMVEFR